MKYTHKGAFSSAPKLLTASLLSVLLVACGGGTSGDGTLDAGTDSGAVDSGGLDGFGLDAGDTDTGSTDEGFIHGGGLIDSDGNGISDENEVKVCKGFPGTDEISSNANWNDNCEMRATIDPAGVVNHPFYISSYAQGIQRVVYCSGNGGVSASTAAFADGNFGPNTANAVLAFQQAENDEVVANQAAGIADAREILVVDGIVGPKTWSRLQSKVDGSSASFIAVENNLDGDYEVLGVQSRDGSTIDCSAERNFVGLLTDNVISAWRLTDTPGGTGVKSFSIGAP